MSGGVITKPAVSVIAHPVPTSPAQALYGADVLQMLRGIQSCTEMHS